MEIHFINRIQDSRRREFVTGNAGEKGFVPVRVDAIDGHLDTFLAEYSGRLSNGIEHGTAACFLSHERAWQIAAGRETTVIVEDDAAFEKTEGELAELIQLAGDFDIIFINGRSIAYRDYAGIQVSDGLIQIDRIYATAMRQPKNNKHPRWSRIHRDIKAPGGDGYIQSRRGAEKLLAESEADGACTDVDCWMMAKTLPLQIH